MNDPSHIHLGSGKKVLRYSQGTLNYRIKYDNKVQAKLISFFDNDWEGCVDDMKRTSRCVF